MFLMTVTYTYVAHEQKAHDPAVHIIVGMVNGCGYGWPTKIYTICDTCRRWAVPLGLKHSEASFSPNRRIRCVYESLRYLDLER